MKASELALKIRQAFAPPPRLKLSEWAEENAVLSAESSAEEGKWRSFPYQPGIMDAISDRHIESVTVMKSARVGWTKIINHTIGYHIHHDPCPIMVVQPTIGDAEGYSKDEIAPMLRDTPALDGLVAPASKRDSGNTVLKKLFPGGLLSMIGADSPRGFRRVSIRVLLFDEVDGYSATAGEEGDQIKLGIRRTEFFWNRKILAGSTPTLDQTSRINRRFLAGDQRRYFVPCPECDHPQYLKWKNFRWEKGKPETVLYHCESCGVGIPYTQQRWMMETAQKRHEAGDLRYGWVATNDDCKDPRHASFHIWAAYSYSPNASWEQLVKEWLESHKNIEERKTFENTVLGETYKGEGDAPDWKRLYDRREGYQIGVIPAGGIFLTMGVDIQKDRIEAEVIAWGRRDESWSVDYIVIPGLTDVLTGSKSAWPTLTDFFNKAYPHENGGSIKVSRMGVDSGYNTMQVYKYVSKFSGNTVLAMDGRGTYKLPIGNPKPVEINERGKRKGKSVMLWPVGDGMIKTELYGWLKQDKPTDESDEEMPWGYCHFPQYSEDFFKGLVAEEIVPRLVKGFRRYQWEKVFERNEPLDCRKYGRAAAVLHGIDRFSEEKWAELEALTHVVHEEQPDESITDMLGSRKKSKKPKDPYL